MYCTPCARLMKSITPNTSVSPAATGNSSTPSCSPLKHWTTNSAVDMGVPTRHPGIRASEYPGPRRQVSQRRAGSRLSALKRSGRDDGCSVLLQLTVLGVAVALGLEDLLHDLGLE